jgi:4-amino-4-deoxy-L-arabinose transferase-like glycosyltransferase
MKAPDAQTLGRRTLIAIFLLTLVLKVVFLLTVADNPFVIGLTNDESHHVEEAGAILRDGMIRDDAFYFAPLYPYLLAALFALLGERISAILFLQAVLGAVNIVLVMLLAEEVLASRRASLIAGALTLLFGPYFMYESLVLKSTLAVLMTSLSLLLLFRALHRSSPWLWFGCGTTLGLLTLVRGNVLVVLPVLFVGLVCESLRRRLTPGFLALWLVGVACGILPATVHNAFAAVDFVPTTYQGGTNFYIGNHRGANGTYQSLRPGRGHPAQEKFDAVDLAEQAIGRSLWPSEVSNYWFRRGFRESAEDPVAWLRLTLKKWLLFHSDAEIMDVVDFGLYRELEPQLWLAPVSFGMILGFTLPGIFFARRLSDTPLLLLVLVASGLSVVGFFVFGRYRLAVVSLHVVFASIALATAVDLALARKWRLLVALIGVVLVVWGASTLPVAEANPAMAHNTLAGMFARQGNLEDARKHLEQVVQELPDQPELRYNLANLMRTQHDYCAAAEQYGQAAEGFAQRASSANDPIIRLQFFEITDARVGVLDLCETASAIDRSNAAADRSTVAGRLLEDIDSGRLSSAPGLLERLKSAAALLQPQPLPGQRLQPAGKHELLGGRTEG